MKYQKSFLSFLSSKSHKRMAALGIGAVFASFLALEFFSTAAQTNGGGGGQDDAISQNAERMLAEGKQTFRFDTFGDEAFWGDTLRLHEAIAKLSPNQALALGLKVDVDALTAELIEQIRRGEVDFDDPAVTLLLLKLNAVVGVTGRFGPDGNMQSIGIQCPLCHSTVDDALLPSIGHRLDAWPNRDLNVGGIIASAPDLSVFVDLLGNLLRPAPR